MLVRSQLRALNTYASECDKMKNPLIAAVQKFARQYHEVPGVLAIDRDDLFSNSILVFVDKTKYKHDLPQTFSNFNVSIYDVQYILAASNKIIDVINKDNVNISTLDDKNRDTYDCFMRAAELCREMLAI